MKILEFLDENRIISELTSTKKVEVLKELIATLATYEKKIDKEELLRGVLSAISENGNGHWTDTLERQFDRIQRDKVKELAGVIQVAVSQ